MSNILIVDDNPVSIQMLSNILRPTHEVYFATNGERALEITQQQALDMVLLDIIMPGMDGYEVCRRLKAAEKTRDIPVLCITAMSQLEQAEKGFAVGISDYLEKPFNAAIVLNRVHNYLRLSRRN